MEITARHTLISSKSIGKVYLIGAGPGSPDLLTLRGRDAIASADVIVHDALIDPKVLDFCRPDAKIISMGKRGRNPRSTPQQNINDMIVQKCHEGQIVARVKGGDALVFGRAADEIRALRANKFVLWISSNVYLVCQPSSPSPPPFFFIEINFEVLVFTSIL